MSKRRELTRAEELANAISHGIGVGLSIAALVVLLIYANLYGNGWHMLGFSIYGVTLIILYLASTLYHSFPAGRIKRIFRVLDHSSIYLLIAGTYTPLTIIALRGVLGWSIFGIVWGIAITGIVLEVLWINKYPYFSTILYIIMGWMVVIAIKPLITVLGSTDLMFLVLGGVSYTVGVIFYIWRNLKFSHAIWHLFVLGGSFFHFLTVFRLLPR